MGIERIMEYECKVCGRKIEVSRTGDVYEEPVYCCGMESLAIGGATAPSAPAKVAVKKKPAKKQAVKKAAKKPAKKKAITKAVKKKAVKKKAGKKAAKKTAKKRR